MSGLAGDHAKVRGCDRRQLRQAHALVRAHTEDSGELLLLDVEGERVVERLARREVVVDGAVGDAGAVGHVLDRKPHRARLGDLPTQGIQDGFTRVFLVFFS